MNKYTKEDILQAAKDGEVSMIDAEHIVSILERKEAGVYDQLHVSNMTFGPLDEDNEIEISIGDEYASINLEQAQLIINHLNNSLLYYKHL